jgi:hypothetical protein
LKLGNGEEKGGGRENDANLENLFEAFLGALLMDKDLAAVKKFIYDVMIPEIENGSYDKVTDYKSALQEIFIQQAKLIKTIKFHLNISSLGKVVRCMRLFLRWMWYLRDALLVAAKENLRKLRSKMRHVQLS